MTTPWTFRLEGNGPYALLRKVDDFGFETFDLLRPPGRFWSDGTPSPATVALSVDSRRAQALPAPADLLANLPAGDGWRQMTRRSLARLQAWFLVCEDPQRRLDVQAVETLAHQASLVQHVLLSPQLQRVLIADEVGLGKTVEAGLIVKQLLADQPGLRILYLAPARLVANVQREFRKLELDFRSWTSGDDNDARLRDPRIIASIHKASHAANFAEVISGQTWDVVIIDECHHLSAWGRDQTNPVQKYKLAKALVDRLGTSGRLILMSGTPHQGHPDRFRNLVALLRRDDESDEALAGRVIYRTKEDVQDWEGRPLFPQREVRPPTVIDLGPDHRAWLTHIHDFFEPPDGSGDGDARRRAAGWRCGMALQWATSSIEAGLGFLARQAIRAGWTPRNPALREALHVLRPYRQGSPDETIESVFERMVREVGRQEAVGDVDDIEEVESDGTGSNGWVADPELLSAVLHEGVALLRRDPDAKWREIRDRILAEAGSEKVVMFAQPIETVTALSRFLERETGTRPALIIGNQSEELRQAEIDSFWKPDGPRFLISSRAGGEGLNLQVARRLVHVDVPWNPMELEQRVGRVHRFMSRKKILVDTVVVKDSREVHAYRIAREKLRTIAGMLVAPERFEALFSRVMALVAPEDFQGVLQERPLGPLSDEEQARISQLVTQGFDRWRSFDAEFAGQQAQMRTLDPGVATWDDIAGFAREHLRAKPVEGYSSLRFQWVEGEVQEAGEASTVFEIGGKPFACGDYGAMPVTRSDGSGASRLGLNVPEVAQALRAMALVDEAAGAAHVRWPAGRPLPLPGLKKPFGVVIIGRHSVRWQDGTPVEAGTSFHAWVVEQDGKATAMEKMDRGNLVRGLGEATQRQEAEQAVELVAALQGTQDRLVNDLRRPTEADREQRVSHGAFPLLAAVVS